MVDILLLRFQMYISFSNYYLKFIQIILQIINLFLNLSQRFTKSFNQPNKINLTMNGIKTVGGIHLAYIKYAAIYIFGEKRFIDMVKGDEIKINIAEGTNIKEIARFELYWKIKIITTSINIPENYEPKITGVKEDKKIDDVYRAFIKKMAIYTFGEKRFLNIIKNGTTKVNLTHDADKEEIELFKKFWKVDVVTTKI